MKHGKEKKEEERKLRLRLFLLKAIKVWKRFFNCRFNALLENPTDLICWKQKKTSLYNEVVSLKSNSNSLLLTLVHIIRAKEQAKKNDLLLHIEIALKLISIRYDDAAKC